MEWLAPIFNIALPLLLLLTGYGVGRVLERRHLVSIRARERELQSVIALNTRYVPAGVAVTQTTVVMGSVVVSSDYFKTFVAAFRNMFGGRFRGYESLLERARREALLRMKSRAREADCSLIIGVRFHTTSISGSRTPSVEIMAYGTALKTQR